MFTKVQSLIDAGFLKALVDFDKISDYWQNMLKDFPGHPAGSMPTTSIPLTLYGHLTKIDMIWFGQNLLCDNSMDPRETL